MAARNNHHGSALALLLAAALPACVQSAPDGAADPLAVVQASEHVTAELGVTTWEVRAEGLDVRVIGSDTDAARKVEMIIHRDSSAPEDLVHIRTVFPEQGELTLTRAGVVEGAPSSYLGAVAAAIHADIGQRPGSLAVDPGDGPGTIASASTWQGEGHIYMGWSMWGYTVNTTVNDWCREGTRSNTDAYASYGNSCWVNRWTSDVPTDCRIELHYAIAGWRTDQCNWFVYGNP